jgi:penicillin amidase
MPSIWYQVGLHAPGWDVTGFSFAGIPGVIVGHNNRIAWGVTNVGPDVQDLYIESVNPDNPNQYEYMGEWRDMNVIEEVIKVNGGEDVVLTVRETLHGPIISDVLEDQPDVLALRWTAASGPSRILQSVLSINQAQNFDAFREALRYWDIPSQNFVYADVDGNIGYQTPSLIPIRTNGQGMVPVPGWTGEYEWEATSPSRSCRPSITRSGLISSPPTTPWSTRRTPTSSPATGPAATAASASPT